MRKKPMPYVKHGIRVGQSGRPRDLSLDLNGLVVRILPRKTEWEHVDMLVALEREKYGRALLAIGSDYGRRFLVKLLGKI